AAMVKAGVYLILRVAPALAHLEAVTIVLAAVGAATMLVGGWRALRQTDIKLLLAYGTVSQLGFLSAVAAVATRDAVMVALAMLIAHAVFKAPLFMVVGIIDKMFGTRDLRMLSGVGRAAPVVAVIGIVSAASMAAIPPLYGFVAKEAIYTALWYGGGWQRLLLIALIAGSILTVAYSRPFVIGALGPAPGAPRVEAPRIAALCWPPPPAAPPLLASAVTLGLGIGLSLLARPVAVLQKRLSPQSWADGGLLEALDAERGFRRILRATDAVSIVVTTLFQRGSLPYTLGTMLVAL